MSDISMCCNINCALKKTCYRFNAPINPYRQAYMAAIPDVIDGVTTCEYYWKEGDVNGEID